MSTFLSGLSFYTPVAPIFFLSKGVDLSLIIISQAVYSIAIILAEVPTGVLADKIGNKRSMVLGSICEVIGMATFLVLQNVWGLFIGYILLGIGEAFQSGSKEALLYEGNKAEGKKKDFKKHFSHILSYNTLAFALGTALVGVLYGIGGLGVIPLLIGLSMIAKSAALFINTKLHNVEIPAEIMLNDANMWQTFRASISVIRADSTLSNLTIVKILTLTAQYVVLSSYQTLFVDNKVSAYFIGFVLTLGGLANAISMRYIHRLEKYLTLEKVVLILNILLGVTYLLFSSVTSPVFLVLVFVLLQAQYNLQEPIISDYINDRTKSGIRATVLSGISLIRQFGNTVSKVALGLVVAGVGVSDMLRLQAIYLVIGAVISYWLLVRCGCTYKLSYADEL